MENLTTIGLLTLVFGLIFSAVYFLPTLVTKWRATTLGLNLTLGQARIITKDHCNKKEFLLSVRDIWLWADIPIEKLTSHYHAKGDLTNIKDGIIEMRRKNKDIDFLTLSAFDLAGRNLREAVKKAETSNWTFDLTTE